MLFTLLFLLPVAGFSQDTGVYCSESTTWNGTSWSNGEPSADKDVIFKGDYTVNATSLNACSLFVLDAAHVHFTQNANAIVTHNVSVAETAQLIFESNCNLIQSAGEQNTGKVTVKRNSSKISKNDFTLWSSPVSGQTLLGFSPQTLTNRFYSYSTIDNIYNTVQNPASTPFTTAKGYLILAGDDSTEEAANWEGNFTGTPNNGNISIALNYVNDTKAYNAVGNPYPSPLNITKFLNENSNVIDGTIWLWRKTDDPAKSSYATVTKLGYQANSQYDSDNTIENPYSIDPQGIVNTGQGFIVKAKKAENLVFNNAMRESINTDAFFRTMNDSETVQASRFWLNVTAANVFSQTLIGYTADATTGFDYGMDGEAIMDGGITLYSLTGATRLAIQARPEFTANDVVPMGFKAQTAGTFNITLDHTDGLFTQGQHIYIKDNTTGITFDLNNGSYSFTSEAGTFENRFTVVYNQTLGINTPEMQNREVIVYTNNKQVKVQSSEQIEAVTLYDMLGRILYQDTRVNEITYSSSTIATQQVIIAKVTLVNGTIVSKKILLQ